MKVVVATHGPLADLPPAQNLIQSLLRLGHSVVCISFDLDTLPNGVLRNSDFHGIDLGSRKSATEKILSFPRFRKAVRQYLHAHRHDIDAVWTTTDLSAREGGKDLLDFPYVMQLAELVEYVPLFLGHPLPFESKLVPKLARKADVVVVPEYNRAYIQQAVWDLPKLPFILPNKPQGTDIPKLSDKDKTLVDSIAAEERKVLLYQGCFAPDRDLRPYVQALDLLEDFCMYLMGPINNSVEQNLVDGYVSRNDRVKYLGVMDSPKHLSVTKHGYIGVLPYSIPKGHLRTSVLNPVYCAPNKIWEYSQFGLPMIGSDVPGLRSVFERYQMGLTPTATAEGIAEAVRQIDSDYEDMSLNSKNYYASIDYDAMVQAILEQLQ